MARPPAGHRGPGPFRAKQVSIGFWLAGPAGLLMILFTLAPVLAVGLLSLTDYQLGTAGLNFIGSANYTEMLADRTFRVSLVNTLIYAAGAAPGSVLLGLALAWLIEARPEGRAFYRTIFFLPVMTTSVAMLVVWEFILHPNFGLLNLVLAKLGLTGANWLQDRSTALLTVCLIGIWQTVGFSMILFMAGLRSIPRELYEAAALDGAGSAWARFRLVTWPLLGPVTLFVLIITTIRSFQVFDTVSVLTQGGPNRATEVLLYTMYSEGFVYFRTGYASALTMVFLVLVLALTALKFRLTERKVHYA